MQVSQIKIRYLPNPPSEELSDLFIRFCEFCNKKCESKQQTYNLCEKMSGDDVFYCSFCLRNQFNTNKRKNILILSFRSIFSWFYYQNYLSNFHKRIWFSEIKDYIEIHKKCGEANPVFAYDDETLLWFIDFSKVGVEGKKQDIIEIYKTVMNILVCFNLKKTIPALNVSKFFNKFKASIDKFHQKTFEKSMLIPTLNGCGLLEMKIPSEKMKNFNFESMKCEKYS